MGIRVVRVQFEGASVFRFRFSPVPFFLQDIGQHDVGFARSGSISSAFRAKLVTFGRVASGGTPEKTVPRKV